MRCGQDGVGVMIIGHRYCILYEIHLNILGVWFQSTFKDHPTCVTKSETYEVDENYNALQLLVISLTRSPSRIQESLHIVLH